MLGKKLIPLTENRAAAEMREMVSYLLESEESFAIWGAGSTGQRAMEYLDKNGGVRKR